MITQGNLDQEIHKFQRHLLRPFPGFPQKGCEFSRATLRNISIPLYGIFRRSKKHEHCISCIALHFYASVDQEQ